MASSEAQKAFLERDGAKLPPREGKERVPSGDVRKGLGRKPLQRKSELARGAGPKRSKRIQEVPPERRGFWHGAMCAHLRHQETEPGFDGFYRCCCGDPSCEAQVEGFDDARRYFVPGHLKPRASFNHRGFRLTYVATLGPDDPTNIVPVSPECNRSEFWKRHQEQPEWSKGESA